MIEAFKKCLLVSAVVLLPMFAKAQQQLQPLDEQKLEKAATLLAGELSPYVVTLTHDIELYHYYKSDLNGADVATEDYRFKDKFVRLLNAQWRPKSQTARETLNPYVYAAVDPAVTRGFGDTMMAIKIRSGSKILAGHLWIKYSLTAPTMQALTDLGYPTFYQMRFDMFFSAWPKQLIARVLKKLDVVAGSYSYARTNGICTKRGAQVAFTIYGHIDDEANALAGYGVSAPGISVKGFTNVATDFSDPVKLADYTRVEQFINAFGQQLASVPNVPQGQSLTQIQIDQWKQTAYACDGLYPDEPTIQ